MKIHRHEWFPMVFHALLQLKSIHPPGQMGNFMKVQGGQPMKLLFGIMLKNDQH